MTIAIINFPIFPIFYLLNGDYKGSRVQGLGVGMVVFMAYLGCSQSFSWPGAQNHCKKHTGNMAFWFQGIV